MNTDDIRAHSLRIAAVTGLDPRTVAAVLSGRRALRVTRKAVETAARDMGIALPPCAPDVHSAAHTRAA